MRWEAVERDESPPDAKNHDEFIYRSYTSMPSFTSQHTSMLAQLLKPEEFDKLRTAKTSTGFTFSNLIQSGVVGHNTPVGIMLGDDECIALFGSIIAPMAQVNLTSPISIVLGLIGGRGVWFPHQPLNLVKIWSKSVAVKIHAQYAASAPASASASASARQDFDYPI